MCLGNISATEINGIIDARFFDEGGDYFNTVFIKGNTNNLNTVSFVFIVKVYETWYLFSARGTPRCPQIKNHYLAFIVLQHCLQFRKCYLFDAITCVRVFL